MNNLQIKLTEMLGWFHDFCVENKLRYYTLAGTCLGMVRHKGFIPWDDDIDVGMPREDYNSFVELMKNGLEHYKLDVPTMDDKYLYTYAKLYDTNTTLIENNRHKLKRGIFIDVFPLDGAGNDLEKGKEQYLSINKKINLICLRNCVVSNHRAVYKNAAIIMSRLLPRFILNENKLIKQVIEESAKYKFDECKIIANFSGDWGTKEVFKKEWFGEPVLYNFENIKIYGPVDADSYLTNLYGDYMTPPPPEKRVSHHDFLYLNLEEGYIQQ